MQVITLINQKGGAGKSPLARGLLSAADARGMRAGFLDTDKTENLVQWAGRAAASDTWSDRIEGFKTLNAAEARDTVLDLDEEGGMDLFIVDTPGSGVLQEGLRSFVRLTTKHPQSQFISLLITCVASYCSIALHLFLSFLLHRQFLIFY